MSEQSPEMRLQHFNTLYEIARLATGQAVWGRDPVHGRYDVWQPTDQSASWAGGGAYWHIEANNPDKLGLVILEPRTPYERNPLRDATPFTVSHIANHFIGRAKDADELAHYVDGLTTWLVDAERPTHLRFPAEALIVKCLRLPENPFLQTGSPIVESLTRARTCAPLLKELGTILGRGLFGTMPYKNINLSKEKPNYRAELLQMVEVLGEKGLLPLEFWYTFGVKAGLVFRSTAVLELALTNLATPEGVRSLRAQKISGRETVLKDYINAVLSKYGNDAARDGKKIAAAQETIKTPLGGTIMGQLISIGQGVTKTVNQRLQREYGAEPDELLSPLDPTRTVQVGEALFRILEDIRLPNLSEAVAAAQREEDSMHTAMLEVLHMALLGGQVARTPADMRTRTGLSDTELRDVMGELPTGQFPISFTAYHRRKKRNPDSPIKAAARDLHKPGGLLS